MTATAIREDTARGSLEGAHELADRERTALQRPRERRILPTGWPLVALFAGYPLWWVLGIAPFVALACAIPLAFDLRRQRRVLAPRGFGLWLLFLAWMLVGLLVLQVDAPDAIPSTSYGRYGTFVFRFAWFVAATVILLWVGTMRRTVSALWVARTIGAMFIVCVAGGLLGTFFPRLEFPSLLELILPGGASKAGFIQGLIHPSAAQIQDFLGFEQGRPSAPFPFTNQWGLSTAVSMPFFIVGWFYRASGTRRLVGAVTLALAVIPIVWSLNRGLWLALLVCAAILAIRAALQGKPAILVSGLVVLGIAGLMIVASPLGDLVQERLGNGNSNQGRTNLGTQTLVSTWQGSPVIGFGSTRDPAGNWVSIAAGSTAECPRCTPPPMGTQGQLWFILFATGFGGVLLYYAFLVGQALKALPSRSVFATAGGAAVTMHLVTSPFYNAVDVSLLMVFAAVGLMWRERAEQAVHPGLVELPLGRYRRLLRRHIPALAIALTVGSMVGVMIQAGLGTPHEAHQRVYVRDIRNGDTQETGQVSQLDFSLDTEAMIMRSERVLDAVRVASGRPLTDDEVLSRLRVTALPNTRVLVIHVTLNDAKRAVQAAQDAAKAYLEERARILNAARTDQISRLKTHVATIDQVVKGLSDAVPADRRYRLVVVRDELAALDGQRRYFESVQSRLENNPIDVGRTVGLTSVDANYDGWLVKAGSGLALALVVWAAWVALFDGSVQRVTARRWPRRPAAPELPIVAVVSAGGDHNAGRRAVQTFGPLDGVLAPWGDAPSTRLSQELEAALPTRPDHRPGAGRVLLVMPERTRSIDVRAYRKRARLIGLEPIGIILVKAKA